MPDEMKLNVMHNIIQKLFQQIVVCGKCFTVCVCDIASVYIHPHMAMNMPE